MSEAIANKDPVIKLFGRTIQLPDFPTPSPVDTGDNSSSAGEAELEHKGECDDCKDENKHLIAEELQDRNPIPEKSDIIEVSPSYNDCSTTKTSKSEEEQAETSNSQEKILKKPDKILPCPRCNSMETKFCYFNNYNISQPRHFCKNCQRYWTAGGTIRNVPVGAGRRKHKNPVLHYRHISVSETLTDLSNGIQPPPLKLNGTILAFNTDKPLCESMGSVLNIADKTMQNCPENGFHIYKELGIQAGDNGDDRSDGSSVTAVSAKDSDNGSPDMPRQKYDSFSPHLPCFTGAPWPYPWSSVHLSDAVPPPGCYFPGFPMPCVPAYWGCVIPGSWNIPWMSPPTASQNQMPPTSSPNSPTLGKHPRDEIILKSMGSEEEPQKESNPPEKCLWFPKTLRIGDPGEAAKSSIWSTLGIKHDVVDSVSGRSFKAFLPKSDERNHVSENSSVLKANPAAMSRSLNFNESS